MSTSLDALFARADEADASDLHLQAGCKPWIRVRSELCPLKDLPIVDAQRLRTWALEKVEPETWKQFEAGHQLEIAVHDSQQTPWRATFVHHEGSWAVALRRLAKQVPSLKQLTLPTTITRLAHFSDGLLLFSGRSGAGKSTTMACVLDMIHQRCKRHIITLEEPVEYLFGEGKSVIQQRAVGDDVTDVEKGIADAQIAGADIVLIGDLRGEREADAALAAAESGMLFLASLHAGSAVETIERLVHLFPAQHHALARSMAARSLRCVVWQTLIPRLGKGRVPACEVLFNTPAVTALVRDGKFHDVGSQLQTGQRSGMLSLDRALRQLVMAGQITEADEQAHQR